MRQDLDWTLIRFQYETCGAEVEDLATEFEVSPKLIQYAIDEEAWQRHAIAEKLQEWKLDPDLSPAALDDLSEKQSLLNTIKRATLNPKYVALETAILSKAHAVLQNLNAEHPGSATVIKTICEILKTLKADIPTSADTGGKDTGTRLMVQVVNRVGSEVKEVPVDVKPAGVCINTDPQKPKLN